MPSTPKKRILITRSRHQTSALAAQLQSLGAEPILIPTISIAPPSSYALLDAAIAQLDTFQWLLFTSANAVESFAQRAGLTSLSEPPPKRAPYPLQSPGSQPEQSARWVGQSKGWKMAHGAAASPDATALTRPRVAAIGPATAHALTTIGLTPDLIPPQAVAESLAQALLSSIAPRQTRMLLLRAEQARDTLPDTLRAAGAHVTTAPTYRNVLPQESIPLLQELFRTPDDWPDAITFTSSSTAANLFILLEAAALTLPTDGAHGKTILRASIGPITTQTLRDLGVPPHLEASEATIPSLVQALAHHLHL